MMKEMNFSSASALHIGAVAFSVRIEAHDRAGLERLLRYCARPAFSMERLRKAVRTWSIAAPNSAASLAVIGAASGQTSSPSHHWS
jgi:hypothetical protein